MNNKSNIVSVIISLILFAFSFILFVFYKNGINEYNSVLDKYLNFNNIILLKIFSAVNLFFAICFFIIFIISVANKNNDKKRSFKVIAIILILIFIVSNLMSGVLIVDFQSNEETVVDTIPETIESYVDFYKIFKVSPNDDYFNEQTVYYKVSTNIPINYSVQQSSSDSSVKTSCIQITDGKLLNDYYNEQKANYSQYNPILFNDAELNKMSADKGFYYISDDYNLNIVIVKGNKLFNVYLFSKNIDLNSDIFQQIVAL